MWEVILRLSKFNKSSKYVIDQWKMDNKFRAFVREKLLSSLPKQTKIHPYLFYKDVVLVLCNVYLVLNKINFYEAMEIQSLQNIKSPGRVHAFPSQAEGLSMRSYFILTGPPHPFSLLEASLLDFLDCFFPSVAL